MQAPSTGALVGTLALIAVAIAIAVAAGSNLALAVPAGAAALTFATALGMYSILATRSEDRRPLRVPDNRPSLRVLRAFDGDRIDREEVVLLLDHVERAGPNPALPSRPRAELAAIVSMNPAGFRRYVASRIEQLERES
ncbi:MAG: hypothetical protein WAN74_06765 [Thermoplasmata archaeon]